MQDGRFFEAACTIWQVFHHKWEDGRCKILHARCEVAESGAGGTKNDVVIHARRAIVALTREMATYHHVECKRMIRVAPLPISSIDEFQGLCQTTNLCSKSWMEAGLVKSSPSIRNL